MRFGIIVLSRLSSSRVPNKAIYKIAGIPVIANLMRRLEKTGLPIICAVPYEDAGQYEAIAKKHGLNAQIYVGSKDDPLKRMRDAAEHYKLDGAIRITHDKIFVEPEAILSATSKFEKNEYDYLYFPGVYNRMCQIDGTAFEIVTKELLNECAAKHKNIEHLSYPFRKHARSIERFSYYKPYAYGFRLLLDYQEDFRFAELLLNTLGPYAELSQVCDFIQKNLWVLAVNQLPKVSIYTCIHNGSEYLNECVHSVLNQDGFSDHMEYVIVDDGSTDDSYLKAFSLSISKHKNVSIHKIMKNVGISSASQFAISKCRAPYVVRIDADDYFSSLWSVRKLYENILTSGADVIIPSNFFGNTQTIQDGRSGMHIGGSMFSKRALDYIKFTEDLRGLEGYDFFKRSLDILDIKFFDDPLFFYRQHDQSLSKGCAIERERIREEIDRRCETQILR